MRLFKAGARILFSRIGQVLANAAVVMVIAKTLGPSGQGHYSLTVAGVLLLASLLGGGMGLSAVPPLRQDKIRPARMFRVQMTWVAGMAVVLGVLAWLSTTPAPAAFLADHLGWRPGWGFLAALAALAVLVFEVFSYNLLARGRLVIGAAVNGYRAMGHLAVVLMVWGVGSLTLGLSVAAFAVAQTAGGAAMLILVLREFRRPLRELPGISGVGVSDSDVPDDLDRRSLLALIGYNLRRGWIGQISAVAYFLLLRLDQGLLEHFRGAAEVGIYSVAVYVGEMLWLLPGAITPLLVHSSADDGGSRRRDTTAVRAVQFGFLLTLAAALPLFFLAEPLLKLLAGGEYAGSGPALRALLPGIVLFAPGAVLAGDFIGRGKPHWNTQASAATVAVNLLVAWQLIPLYGPVGAAWSSTIAYAVGGGIMLIRFRSVLRKEKR
jgi:O-antigen/teichoic acid export membrane protein|nr:polysaccharide biosynthesis C-terminal domain-containing protein [Candidatus Krumholzibacteria bacterium]